MTDRTDATETIASLYATGLRNAHAMETQAEELLKRQIERLDAYPDLQARMQEHLHETRTQQERLEILLRSIDETTSTFKDTAMAFVGNLAAAAHMPASDEVLKNAFASVAFENYEIAAYKSLIDLAGRAGATEAVGPLRQSCAEEQAMAAWLDSRIEAVTEQFLARSTGAPPLNPATAAGHSPL
ncbi:ferritin-like metal-binding protein YciE [Roseiarcus fermentans]|uniref:Ferritin-like metal-binding protein YciE n=1 Tax=Roseiarcus fermentans TaxID=1473586 RepID=A0A366FUC7_9HYPH|nr:ferritin-like domain-containing protein [Roseiarcus fermentans]RBP17660.1 ferritin-like metal-binding protein YciE [Roseiarcus fermentans]